MVRSLSGGLGPLCAGGLAILTVAACDQGPSGYRDDDVVASCVTLGALDTPSVPAALQPPAGARLTTRLRAQGAQIYTCKETAGAYAWSLKAPEAELIDDQCRPAGHHFGGPTWESPADGSRVVGSKMAENAAPSAGAVPWLLLRASSNAGAGMFSPVTFIQRLDTAGGVAPADGCGAATANQELAVPYSATYYFYQGGV